MLIDLSEHDLAVILGGLDVLIQFGPKASEKYSTQKTADSIQLQCDAIDRWQNSWDKINPKDRERIDALLRLSISLARDNIEKLEVSPDIKALIAKMEFRCPIKIGEKLNITACMQE